MAKVYGSGDGMILRVLRTREDLVRFPTPPEGALHVLDLDFNTNPEIARCIDTDHNRCRVLDGQFIYNGVPMTINTPGQRFNDESMIDTLRNKLEADENLTAAELRAILRSILRRLS